MKEFKELSIPKVVSKDPSITWGAWKYVQKLVSVLKRDLIKCYYQREAAGEVESTIFPTVASLVFLGNA